MITNTLAFVTFDESVIAVSINRKSMFEESVILIDNDEILGTVIHASNNIDIATIYTLASGILQFDIDAEKICAPEKSGNMYARIVEEVVRVSI